MSAGPLQGNSGRNSSDASTHDADLNISGIRLSRSEIGPIGYPGAGCSPLLCIVKSEAMNDEECPKKTRAGIWLQVDIGRESCRALAVSSSPSQFTFAL